jgi:hypothetical protein
MSRKGEHHKQQLKVGGQEEDAGGIKVEQPCHDCCKGGVVAQLSSLPILWRRCRCRPQTIAIIVLPNNDVGPSSFQFVPTPRRKVASYKDTATTPNARTLMIVAVSASWWKWRRWRQDARQAATTALAKMLHFQQWDWCSASAARQISKNRVSSNSPGRILLGDVLDSLRFGPQWVIGHCKWPSANSCFNCRWPLRPVKKIETLQLSHLLARGMGLVISLSVNFGFSGYLHN